MVRVPELFLSSSSLKVFLSRRVKCQVDRQPYHLCISIRPDTKGYGEKNHGGQHDHVGFDVKHQAQQDKRNNRCEDNEQIADGSVRQEVSRFPHEVEPALRTAVRRIEVSVEDLAFPAHRTTQPH